MALVVDVADAVVAALNAGSFSQAFQAERQYVPLYDLKGLQSLKVTVVPKGQVIEGATRTSNAHEPQVDVAVQKRLATTDKAEIDGLMDLVDEIADRFRLKRLDSFPDAVWVRTENDPVYVPEHLHQLRVFTGLLTFTFRVVR